VIAWREYLTANGDKYRLKRLAAAAVGLGLPRNTSLGLFIVGRTVGWIAHAIEQYESGVLIRPRARYLGPQPNETAGEGQA